MPTSVDPTGHREGEAGDRSVSPAASEVAPLIRNEEEDLGWGRQ